MRWHTLIRPRSLKDFQQEMAGYRLVRRYPRGVVSIPVAKVVGSLNKAHSLNRRFGDKRGKVDLRLERLRDATQWGMATLPPIDVYQLGDEYYVVDGHHRMAVALEHRQIEIDANVVVHEIEPRATSPGAGAAQPRAVPSAPSLGRAWLVGGHRRHLPALTPWLRRWQAAR